MHYIRMGVTATLLLSGCASVSSIDTGYSTTEKVTNESNYTLGVPRVAVVGEDLVRSKEIDATTAASDAFEAPVDITIENAVAKKFIPAGSVLPVVGMRNLESASYKVADIGNGRAVEVAVDGTIRDKMLNGIGTTNTVEMLGTFHISPDGVKLRPTRQSRLIAESVGKNYEIVFNGIDASAMHFQYREFTSADLARPAFSQDLSYPLSAKRIRFKQLDISVQSVNAEEINYIVISDKPAAGTPPAVDAPKTPQDLARDGKCDQAKTLAGSLGDAGAFREIQIICDNRH